MRIIESIAALLFSLADAAFSLSLYIHRRFDTDFNKRRNRGIKEIEERLDEIGQLEAMREMGNGK